MHTVEKGDLSVAMFVARCLQLRFVVLKPISELSRYDIVIDRGAGFERIQCKTGRLRGGAVRFNASSSLAHHGKGQGRQSYRGQVEAFGVYCHDNGEVYLVPVERAGTTEGNLRIEPPKNGQATGINLAADFRL